jgi:hypothetical protein
MTALGLVGLLGLTMMSGGVKPANMSTFAVVGVYMDDKNQSSYNTHIVGTWAMNIALPPDSTAAQVQAASQARCAKTAPNGWRCAEMGSWDLELHNRRTKPCAVIALGMYRGVHDDGVSHHYTLWPSLFGFASAGDADAAGRKALRDASAANNNDPLLRVIGVSNTCGGPSA